MNLLIFLTPWPKSRFPRSNGEKISFHSQNSGDQNEVIGTYYIGRETRGKICREDVG